MEDSEHFTIASLNHLEHYFSPREMEALQRHGPEAELLEVSFDVFDLSERRAHFVRVCRGELEPSTAFEHLWLRYKQNCKLDREIHQLHLVLKSLERRGDEERVKLNKEIEWQKGLIAKLQRIADKYDPLPKESLPSTKHSSCRQCGGDGGSGGQCPRCGGNGFEPQAV